MSTTLRVLTLILAAISVAPVHGQPEAARVVMISIDGLMPVSYTQGSETVTPNLLRLAKDGVWAEGVIGVLPTVTYPSHTTLITGVEPARHGIIDNRIVDPENLSAGAWYWYARDIVVPTLPMAARARGLRAAAISWPVTIGMDLDYLVPEYFRSRHSEALSMLRALSQPRTLLDAAESARGKPFAWPPTDRERTDWATFVLKNFDPHLLLVHLIDLDATQHDYGPGSPEALATLKRVDGHVGEIVDAVRTAGRSDRTNVVVVSDHGFLPLKQQLQPNAAFKNAGLLTVNERGTVTAWQAYFHSSGGAGFVYVKDAAQFTRVQAILTNLRANPSNGIREVWTRDQLAEKGAHPDAVFGLDVVDGFYTSSAHDVIVKPSESKGGHGFAPDRLALHASFVMAGPSVQKRGTLGIIRMTSIAPTIAAILKVSLAPSASPALTVTSP
jgi:predicted AlkP superfamily pyrophosphatase or phosphodiesterase